jgi:hypothetical protein
MNAMRRRKAKARRREKSMRVTIIFDYTASNQGDYFPRDNGARRIYTGEGEVFRLKGIAPR